MKETKKTDPLLRLTLPAAAVQRLRKAGIYCTPSITVEFQQATKRHVLRGRESGGAIKQFGHYVTFCGHGGERLPWFVRPDSLTSNGDHAIVLAPALVSVEALRVEHTYELLIARHELRAEKEGARPGSGRSWCFGAGRGNCRSIWWRRIVRSRERSRPSFSPGRERLDNCRLRLWRQFTLPRKPSAAFFAPIRTSLSSLPTTRTTYNKKDGGRRRKARAEVDEWQTANGCCHRLRALCR